MKIFSFYLPQFHEIDENNRWWGKGFTEWTNVRKALPLFEGHQQPQEPLNDNYYNLLDKEVVQWQTKLMHKYQIDGLIYYHYYFKGKKLLEKPAENLLKNKKIDQSFFLCWANHSWMRTWEGKQDVLIEQTYGDETDWEKHFQYLLPFFQDERYERKDNCPIFMVFKSDFKQRDKMFAYFNKRCKEVGFNGIYLIETFHGTHGKLGFYKSLLRKSRQTKAIFVREPSYSQRCFDIICKKTKNKEFPIPVYDGKVLYQLMIKKRIRNKRAIQGVFFEWDNTPRHGKRGYIITPPDKQIFFKYMDICSDSSYIFINAWNEWAEGMMLEPTKKNEYKYLEWVSEWKETANAIRHKD